MAATTEEDLRRLVLPTDEELDAAISALRAAVESTLLVAHRVGRYQRRYEERGEFVVEEGDEVPTHEDVGRVYAYFRRAHMFRDEIDGYLDADEDLAYLDDFRPVAQAASGVAGGGAS